MTFDLLTPNGIFCQLGYQICQLHITILFSEEKNILMSFQKSLQAQVSRHITHDLYYTEWLRNYCAARCTVLHFVLYIHSFQCKIRLIYLSIKQIYTQLYFHSSDRKVWQTFNTTNYEKGTDFKSSHLQKYIFSLEI